MNFQSICTILVSKLLPNLREMGLSSHEPVNVIVFQHENK